VRKIANIPESLSEVYSAKKTEEFLYAEVVLPGV
jgi:hypothetical protein